MSTRLEDVILIGTRAAQPLATAVSPGTLYYVSNESVLERSNGTTWVSYSVAVVAGGITQLTGAITAGPGSGSQAAALANDAVTTVKILDANVTTAKIADINVTTGKIANDAITYAKIQNVTDARLLGRSDGSDGDVREIMIGANLTLAAGVLSGAAGAAEWDQEIVKSANQDVTNSTTLVDDTELQFAVTAGSVWKIELILIYSASTGTNDIKTGFIVAAGTAYGGIQGLGPIASDSVQDTVTAMNGATSSPLVFGVDSSGLGTTRAVKIETVLKFTNTTTFKFQFAQNAAGVGESSRCAIGSTLFGKRIL